MKRFIVKTRFEAIPVYALTNLQGLRCGWVRKQKIIDQKSGRMIKNLIAYAESWQQ